MISKCDILYAYKHVISDVFFLLPLFHQNFPTFQYWAVCLKLSLASMMTLVAKRKYSFERINQRFCHKNKRILLWTREYLWIFIWMAFRHHWIIRSIVFCIVFDGIGSQWEQCKAPSCFDTWYLYRIYRIHPRRHEILFSLSSSFTRLCLLSLD